ncbi:(deoxy)nucleoside triphosphate pyrophosphohydrolase [Gandjariella thermophila]|uniref:(deoxy)nucleoside triphosphate pyrophosphohydrolase n=1 Tax=Gandjariella thermophila TaxID=1931992 RepID=UPI001CEF5E7B|nr:NUDIX domain-containing protein [Gandjariella thermophila]
MTTLRDTVFVPASARAVAAAALDAELFAGSAARAGCWVRRTRGAGRVLAVGDELRLSLPVAPRGPRVPIPLRVVRAGTAGFAVTAIGGPLRTFELCTELVETAGGVLAAGTVRFLVTGGPSGALAGRLLRRPVRRLLAARTAALRDGAPRWASAPVVVGAAIVRDGWLLAQQRRYPRRDAGRWELPGGRVEDGEPDAAALTRECREELGVDVWIGGPVGPDLPLPGDLLLRVYAAEVVGAAEPAALEHRAVRWVTAGELAELDWLDADRALLPALRALLR